MPISPLRLVIVACSHVGSLLPAVGLPLKQLPSCPSARGCRAKLQSSIERRGSVNGSAQSLAIFLFGKGEEAVKFLDALKGILASSRAECKKSRACRAENIFVIDPDEESRIQPWCNFLEAPRFTIRTEPGFHLPLSRSLMDRLFLSHFECSGNYEWPQHFHVSIEPLMKGISTAHRQSHRIPGHQTPVHDGTHALSALFHSIKSHYTSSRPESSVSSEQPGAGLWKRQRLVSNPAPVPNRAGSSAACVWLHQRTNVGSSFLPGVEDFCISRALPEVSFLCIFGIT